MPQYDVLPEIDSVEDRQRLADIARIYTKVRNGELKGTKATTAVLAAAGLTQTASAQPSRDDAYPEIGLHDKRVDGWADGVDSNHTYVQQLGQLVNYITGVSGTMTLDPDTSNTYRLLVSGDTTIEPGSVDTDEDGYSFSVLLEGDIESNVSWDTSIQFPNGETAPTSIGEHGIGIVGLRTYNGGSTWQASVSTWIESLYDEGEGEDDWQGGYVGSGDASKNNDHLYLESESPSSGTTYYSWFDHDSEFDLSEYSYIEADWQMSVGGSGSGEALLQNSDGSVEYGSIGPRSTNYGRSTDAYDISDVTSTQDLRIRLNATASSDTGVESSLNVYSVKFYR